MSRYCIHLAYNGLNYYGWQRQPNGPSVQQTLEEALSTLLHQKVTIMGCGRTDSGVHASDFYAHFDLPAREDGSPALTDEEMQRLTFKLNSFLPPDIALYRTMAVADNFHARFDATARTYQYHVSNKRLPFAQGLYCRIYFTPDLEKMNEAARVLMSYEDFTSFSKVQTQVKTMICHIYEAHWDAVGDEWVFTIRANRFLRNMVRAITGTLLDVGRGKLSVEGLRTIIEKKDRCAAGTSMPAQALFLTKVDYPEESFPPLVASASNEKSDI